MEVRIWEDEILANGYLIDVADIETARFEANPVVLYNHDDFNIPIGRVLNLEKKYTNGIGSLIGVIEFDLEDPQAANIAGKYERGFMKAVSARFHASEKRMTFYKGVEVPKYHKAQLIEISVVAIGGHERALKFAETLPDGVEDLTYSIVTPDSDTISPNKKMKKLCNRFGLSDSATEDELLQKLDELQNSHTSGLLQKQQEIDTLKREIAEKNQQALNKSIDDLLNSAVQQKKILQSEVPNYRILAEGNLDVVRNILDSKQRYPGVSNQIQERGVSSQANDLRNKIETRKDWSFTDWQKKDSNGLSQIKKEMPQVFQEMVDALQR